ncbi:MAG: hypothetical protein V1740_07250 [Candidatus Woesearchaeota archaeon]
MRSTKYVLASGIILLIISLFFVTLALAEDEQIGDAIAATDMKVNALRSQTTELDEKMTFIQILMVITLVTIICLSVFLFIVFIKTKFTIEQFHQKLNRHTMEGSQQTISGPIQIRPPSYPTNPFHMNTHQLHHKLDIRPKLNHPAEFIRNQDIRNQEQIRGQQVKKKSAIDELQKDIKIKKPKEEIFMNLRQQKKGK